MSVLKSQFVAIFIIFGWVAASCRVENVHITLGDYFVDQSSPVVYRVGFMSYDEGCRSVELRVQNEGETHVFQNPVTRPYSFHGQYPPWYQPEQIDYDRVFYFLDITHLHNNEQFEYQFWMGEEEVSRKFSFSSSIFSGKNYRIASFGDHDQSTNGMLTVDRLKETPYDLLILLGDHAYQIFKNNGEKGDDYFAKLEDLLTRAPMVVTPGNHENIDDSLFFNHRFRMPGTENPFDNNMYSFEIGNTIFYSFNFDLVALIHPEADLYYQQVADLFLARRKSSKATRSVFFSHRPIYCSAFNVPQVACPETPFFFKFYEDLLHYLDVNVYLFGHVHTYERFAPIFDYGVENRQDRVFLISGSAGNEHFFSKTEKFDIEFLREFRSGDPGFVVLESSEDGVETAFVESKTGILFDRFFMALPQKNPGTQLVAEKLLV